MIPWFKARIGKAGQDASSVRIAGLDHPITLRRNKRARRFSLRINEAKRGAVLTLPAHASYAEAGDFLARHFDWLRARMCEFPHPVPFVDGARIPLRGADHELHITPRSNGRARVWREDGKRPDDQGSTPQFILIQGPADKAPTRLAQWLKGEARNDFCRCVEHHAGFLDVRPSKISIRDQSTRWGSCSATGALSFSWRLILAPPFVLDYVAAHEAAHLRELNHGSRFWALVRSTAPRLDEAKVWLKDHGPRLHQYGAGH